MTPFLRRSQKPPGRARAAGGLAQEGHAESVNRSPMAPRRAGSRVSAASRAVNTAMIAPSAMLWNRVEGTRNRPPRARITARALKSTERVAVDAGAGDGVDLVVAGGPFLPVAGDHEE